jgi:hypothetical protein
MQHAESASGERAESTASTSAPSPSAVPASAPASDLDRLRDILFGDERDTLDGIDARVAELDRNQRELSARLPAAIERAQEGAGAARIATALAKPVTQALGAAVQEDRQVIVDVLFPVIGPAIRKAIAEALRNLVADMNGAIESSLTPRGIRWRFEAWRSGAPYAQVALKHSLNYGIDHVFLIERESGLVLDRESAPHLSELDADAIAGMLTAIGEFVRDSVDRDGGGTLDSARVGEHVLWIVHGPRANLACFIHGIPPAALHALLEQRLENIHSELGKNVVTRESQEAWRHSLRPDELMRGVIAASRPPAARSRLPLLLVLIAAIGLAAWGIVRREGENARFENLRAHLSAISGFVLTGIDRHGDSLTIHGLLDPDADPIESSLPEAGFAPAQARFDTAGYVSTHDSIIARRARRQLVAPQSVTITVQNGVLALGGHAAPEWIEAAREKAAWIAGVREVRFSVVPELDDATIARGALDALAGTIPEKRIEFVRDTIPAPDSDAVIDVLAADALRAEMLATTAGVEIEWISAGTNDEPGSDAINTTLRSERARWLAYALAARGVANVRSAAEDGAQQPDARRRGAFLKLVVAEKSR